MKTRACILAVTVMLQCCISIVNAQQSTFTKVYYDLSGSAQAYAVVKSFDQNYMITGEKDNVAMVMKVDPEGTILWVKKLGETGNSRFNCITATQDSCFILVGFKPSTTTGNDVFCVKINQTGDTLWTRAINLAETASILSVQQTSDQGFILAGYVTQWGGSYTNIAVIKLDATGNLSWVKILDGGYGFTYGFSVKQTPEGGYIMIGNIDTSCTEDACLIKLTATGDVTWAKQISTFQAFDVAITANGFLCFLSSSGSGISLMKTDFSGNFEWGRTYPGTSGGYYSDLPRPKLHPTSDLGYVFISSTIGMGVMIKTDSTGNVQCGQNFLLNSSDVTESYGNGYLVLGNGPIWMTKAPTNNPQIGLIRTDSVGNTTACTIQGSITSGTCTIGLTPITLTTSTAGSMSESNPAITSVSLSVFEGCVPILGSVAGSHHDESAFLVSPDPSSGLILVINQQLSGQPINKLEIFNSLGEKVYQSSGPLSDQLQVDLTRQADGMYYIKAMYRDKTCAQKILILH
jgi:hypothetical protein